MKKVSVYVLESVLGHSLSVLSPRLYSLLCTDKLRVGLEFELVVWSGTLPGLPRKGEPAMICASTIMHCGWQELAALCKGRGHFPFFHGGFVCMDGRVDLEFEPFYNAYEEFVERFLAYGGVK